MGSARNDKLGQKLLEIKEELEGKKARRAELQGELKSLMKQLQEYGAENLEEAGNLIQQQEKEIKETETSIKEGLREIEEMMEDE